MLCDNVNYCILASQSDTVSFNYPTTPKSPCDSAVFTEGYFSTTLDRKDRKDSSVFSEGYLSTTLDRKDPQTSSEQKAGMSI